MTASRLFEHENDANVYLLWILQTWTDSFEIRHSIGYGIIENEYRVFGKSKNPQKAIKIEQPFWVFLHVSGPQEQIFKIYS